MARKHHQEVALKPAVAVLYADASAAALVDALKAWRQEYAPSAGYEALISEHIRVVQIKTRLLPEGRATVIVTIEANRYGADDAYYYDATLVAGELHLNKITD